MSEYKYKDNVKCPWCNYEHEDSYEFFSSRYGDGSTTSIDCYSCGKEIEVTMHVDVTYSSSIECPGHEFDLSQHEGFLENNEQLVKKELHLHCNVCKEDFYEWSLPGGKYAKIKEGTFKYIGRAKEILELRQLTKTCENVSNGNLSNGET